MARILIANADRKFSDMLKNILAAYGHEVASARTGNEALERFDVGHPAVVLLDLALLGMPGLEVLAKLKARDPRLPVVVVTGDVSIEVEDRAREMGVADVLRRRLKMDVIMQAVNRALQEAGRTARPSFPPVPSPSSAPSTILIVDDETEIREMVGEYLNRRGYAIRTAASGEEALQTIRQTPPDLVLLDIYMPGMNGVELLRKLTKDKFTGGVIMLTASQEEPLLKTALDLGAFDVLSKPVDLDQVELAVMVKLLLRAPDDVTASRG